MEKEIELRRDTAARLMRVWSNFADDCPNMTPASLDDIRSKVDEVIAQFAAETKFLTVPSFKISIGTNHILHIDPGNDAAAWLLLLTRYL